VTRSASPNSAPPPPWRPSLTDVLQFLVASSSRSHCHTPVR
jgi:hypothetical protein